MTRRTLILAFLTLAVLAMMPGIVAADDNLCGYCNDGCNGGTFLGYPMCGTEFGSCAGCRINCENVFGVTYCDCTLFACAPDEDKGPFFQIAGSGNTKTADGPCRLAQLPRKSYRTVRIEVFSARS